MCRLCLCSRLYYDGRYIRVYRIIDYYCTNRISNFKRKSPYRPKTLKLAFAWRDRRAKEMLQRAFYIDFGPVLFLPCDVIDRIIECALTIPEVFKTAEDMKRETRSRKATEYSEETFAVINSVVRPTASTSGSSLCLNTDPPKAVESVKVQEISKWVLVGLFGKKRCYFNIVSTVVGTTAFWLILLAYLWVYSHEVLYILSHINVNPIRLNSSY